MLVMPVATIRHASCNRCSSRQAANLLQPAHTTGPQALLPGCGICNDELNYTSSSFFLGETWTLLLSTAPWELSGESNTLLLMLRGHVTASSMFARLSAIVWCVCVVMLASGARVRASGDLNSASSTAPIHCAFIKCRCLSHPQDHSLLQQLRGSGGLKIPQQMVHAIFLECQSCATTLSH